MQYDKSTIFYPVAQFRENNVGVQLMADSKPERGTVHMMYSNKGKKVLKDSKK